MASTATSILIYVHGDCHLSVAFIATNHSGAGWIATTPKLRTQANLQLPSSCLRSTPGGRIMRTATLILSPGFTAVISTRVAQTIAQRLRQRARKRATMETVV